MITISDKLLDEMLIAPPGTIVRGTYDPKCSTSTIVSLDNGHDQALVHAPIGRVDVEDLSMPFLFHRINGTIVVIDREQTSLPLTVYTNAEFYKRSPINPQTQDFLRSRKILVFGLGSVGSVFVGALAEAGLGSIAASDPDRLEIHNCLRHLLKKDFIGWNKAIAMAEHIKKVNPDCNFIPLQEDLLSGDREPLKEFLDSYHPDAVLALTDSYGAQTLAQAVAIDTCALFFSLGCYNNAIEGEVFFRLPTSPRPAGDSVRYACYEDLHPPRKGECGHTEYDYSTDEPGRYAGEPALSHMINHKVYTGVTLFLHAIMMDSPVKTKASRITQEHLRRGAQYVRLGGPYVTTIEESGGAKTLSLERPWQVKWSRIRGHADCGLCSDRAEVSQFLYPSYDGFIIESVDDCG